MVKVLLFALMFTQLHACNTNKPETEDPENATSGNKPDFSEATSITFSFGDSSVPPPYHRSTTTHITRSSYSFSVDSYGDLIKDTTVEITEEQFQEYVAALVSNGMHYCKKPKEDDGCTGGTSHSLQVYAGNTEIFSANIYHCGSDDYGDLCGDIDGLAQDLRTGINGNVFLYN